MKTEKVRYDYGAELFQRNYPKQASLSFGVAALAISLSFAYPIIKSWFDKAEEEAEIKIKAKRIINYSELSAPPPIDLEKEEVVLKAPPKMKVVKFLPPKVKKDEEVEEVTEMPTMEEMEHTQIGTFDQDGVDSIIVDNSELITLPPEPEPEPEPYSFVQIMPEYPGGPQKLMTYLAQEIKYPSTAKEVGLEGTVFIQFVVEKDGSITGAKIVRGVHFTLDDEALRVIKSMPDWVPGEQNGEKARVIFTVPIRFSLVSG